MGLVVLVQPATNIFDAGKSRPTPPISLLSAVRLVAAEHQVRVVDLRVERRWKESIKTLIRESPLVFGTTSITGNQLASALRITRFIKSQCDIPVVWGGIHGTLFPDQVLEQTGVDVVVRFEGEITFAELVRRLERGESYEDLPGISFRRNGKCVHNPDRDFADMDELPDIPLHLVGRRPWFLTGGRPTVYVETSRGCQSACTFCYNSAYHKRRWRGQSAGRVLAMLDRLGDDYPLIRHLSIVDDNFFGKRSRTRDILEGLIERGAPFTYQVQGAHIGVVGSMGDEDFTRLRRSGCVRLDMGAESGSEELLRKMLKVTSPEKILRISRHCEKAGITAWFNFMIGTPEETEADLDKTISLGLGIIQDNPKALLSPFYLYAPYPGTELYETARKLGFRPPGEITGWLGLHSGEKSTPWLPGSRRRVLQSVYFLSIFVDRKLDVYDTHRLIRLLARLYRPIARWRLSRRRFRWMPERVIFMRLFDIS